MAGLREILGIKKPIPIKFIKEDTVEKEVVDLTDVAKELGYDKESYEYMLNDISSEFFEEGVVLDHLSVDREKHNILLVCRERIFGDKRPTQDQLENMWIKVYRLPGASYD